MKLVLYGGGDEQENLELDQKLLSLFPEVDDLQIAYIPFATEYSEEDFLDFVNQFRKLGIKKIIKLELDRPMNSVLKNIVLKSDIIHLGGGNTFYFLKHLKKSHFMNDLKNWVAKGGVLTGLSAGAILMTKNIETAAIPEFDRDDNDENLKNLNAMSLVNFEFFPHYKNSTRYDREIIIAQNKLVILSTLVEMVLELLLMKMKCVLWEKPTVFIKEKSSL